MDQSFDGKVKKLITAWTDQREKLQENVQENIISGYLLLQIHLRKQWISV